MEIPEPQTASSNKLSQSMSSETNGKHELSEEDTRVLENELGIKTPEDRLIEASLFIDRKFFDIAIITGNASQPERLFGKEAWADYLEARKAARQYGNQDLTLEFILNLQKTLTKRSNPTKSGKIRQYGVYGADYNDPSKPVTYTSEQVKAIEANPYLVFQMINPEDPSCTSGFIWYPRDDGNTEQQITKLLEELCNWFNQEKREKNYDPHTLAATLQHRLVSIHPFLDGNGTVSRLLMNWSLENDGELPSILDNPSEDLLMTEEDWAVKVRGGSRRFRDIKRKQFQMNQIGIKDLPTLFGLQQEQAFYRYIFRFLQTEPSSLLSNGKINHQTHDEFIKAFTEEISTFGQFIQAISTVETATGSYTISQGGLVSGEFLKLISCHPLAQKETLQDYFSEVVIYRGGMCIGELDDHKICQIFESYIGVGTGYRALQSFELPATSTRVIQPNSISEAIDYYNRLIAASYFAQKHPEVENPYQMDQNLASTLRDHIAGGESIWNSPFVSTSLSPQTARHWAQQFNASYAKTAQQGIVFKAHVPKEGVVLSFGTKVPHSSDIPSIDVQLAFPSEQEVLIVGGLHPGSIFEVEIYDRSGFVQTPALIAKRVEREGGVFVEIEDQRGQFIKIRTYSHNAESRHFELVSEEVTDRPVVRLALEKPEKIESAWNFLTEQLTNKSDFDKISVMYKITPISFINEYFDKKFELEKKLLFPEGFITQKIQKK